MWMIHMKFFLKHEVFFYQSLSVSKAVKWTDYLCEHDFESIQLPASSFPQSSFKLLNKLLGLPVWPIRESTDDHNLISHMNGLVTVNRMLQLQVSDVLVMDNTSLLRLGRQEFSHPQQHALNSVKLIKKIMQLTYHVPLPELCLHWTVRRETYTLTLGLVPGRAAWTVQRLFIRKAKQPALSEIYARLSACFYCASQRVKKQSIDEWNVKCEWTNTYVNFYVDFQLQNVINCTGIVGVVDTSTYYISFLNNFLL